MIKNLSKKQLVLFAFILTLLTGFRSGTWSSFGAAGNGRGFPLYFWHITTTTDVIGYVGNSDKQMDLIISLTYLVADILFWFIILFLLRKLLFKKAIS